jgi:glutamate-1-semialdehyde 2,1-aminomutase
MMKDLERLVKEKMAVLKGTAHSYEHVQRVVKTATFLATKEKANVELVQIGALLHDIGWTVGKPHGRTGAKMANRILKDMNYPSEQSRKICKIILHHPLASKDELETLEERIVWDADKIDLLGVVGVARAFHWLSNMPFEAVVKTCFEELTSIYSLLNTETAKKIAKRRRREMMAFLSALREELSLTDLGMSQQKGIVLSVKQTLDEGKHRREVLSGMFDSYASKTRKSKELFERARELLPAGVSYAIRHFQPYPFYTMRAKGSKLFDVDGNQYVDYWLGHTALILGHSPPAVVEVVEKQLEKGTHYGTSHELEIELAERLVNLVPCAEMVRFTNSGTEANMYATRLARTYVGRSKIAKFEGGWHGGYDALHTGVRYPFDVPESAGLTSGALQDTIILPFNNLEGVRERLDNEEVASITIEPVLGAGGGIPAEREFLKGLRKLCDEKGILLIFDEVITGFRLAPGGGQEYYGVTPDITVFGKILGGGFPIGAFCGRKEIMERIDMLLYERPHYSFHGGTFAANPISMAAGLATLKHLEDGQLIDRLNNLGEKIRKRITEIFEAKSIDIQVTGAGSLFNALFTKEEVKDVRTASRADRKKQVDYHLDLIANGVFFLPTHTGALSVAHSDADIEKLFLETEKYARGRKVP